MLIGVLLFGVERFFFFLLSCWTVYLNYFFVLVRMVLNRNSSCLLPCLRLRHLSSSEMSKTFWVLPPFLRQRLPHRLWCLPCTGRRRCFSWERNTLPYIQGKSSGHLLALSPGWLISCSLGTGRGNLYISVVVLKEVVRLEVSPFNVKYIGGGMLCPL